MGSFTGASTAIVAFEQEHRDKSQIMKAFLFLVVFPVKSGSWLVLGGIFGLAFGCFILFIWNLWSLGYLFGATVCILAITFPIYKLLQHEQYGSDINQKWREVFGRPLF